MRTTKLPAPGDTPGRRELRKQWTRSQLLAAGRRLFGEKGLYDSRVEDLTAFAGIAKGTIYGYFADKEALIHAVVSEGFADLLEHVRDQLDGLVSVADRRRRAVRAHLEFFSRNPDLMRVFHQVRGVVKFHRPEWRTLRRDLEDYTVELARELRTNPAEGARPTPREVETAQTLFGAVSGVVSIRASLQQDFSSARTADAIARGVAELLESVAPAESAPKRKVAPRSSSARGSGGRRGLP